MTNIFARSYIQKVQLKQNTTQKKKHFTSDTDTLFFFFWHETTYDKLARAHSQILVHGRAGRRHWVQDFQSKI